MIRRKPTRIELTIEDLNEYQAIRQQNDKTTPGSTPGSTPEWGFKKSALVGKAAALHERIGLMTPNRTPQQ